MFPRQYRRALQEIRRRLHLDENDVNGTRCCIMNTKRCGCDTKCCVCLGKQVNHSDNTLTVAPPKPPEPAPSMRLSVDQRCPANALAGLKLGPKAIHQKSAEGR